ncbi:MAG: hypothetical protein JWP89_3661 [Schlesneria sp.]|nr:hypothetical protein [Schlesneria sp.]
MNRIWLTSLLILSAVSSGCREQQSRAFAITSHESRSAETPESSGGNAPQPTEAAERDSLLNYACSIKPNRGSGVNTTSGVVTCWHCVSNVAGPVQVNCHGETAAGRVIAFDVEQDLALIAVTWQQQHRAAVVSTDAVTTGEVLFSAGRMRDGRVGLDRYRVVDSPFHDAGTSIYTDNPFVSGQSGSGLFNAAGQLVGIVKAVDMTDEPYRGLSTSTAAITKLLRAAAAANGSSTTTKPQPRQRRRAVIGAAAWCEPCRVFRSRNGSGNGELELVYVDIEQPCPATVTHEEWDRLVSTTRGLYGPQVEQAIPLALWQAENGKWYCKTVGGWSADSLAAWVR